MVTRVDRTRLSVAAGPLAGPVLARVVGMLCARAALPLDRLQDAVIVADTVAAHAPAETLDGRLAVSIASGDGTLDMRIGPLHRGGAERLIGRATLPEAGDVIGRLADTVRTESGTAGDYLSVRIGSPA